MLIIGLFVVVAGPAAVAVVAADSTQMSSHPKKSTPKQRSLSTKASWATRQLFEDAQDINAVNEYEETVRNKMRGDQVLADRALRQQLMRFVEWHVEYEEMMMQIPPTAGGLSSELEDFELDMIRRINQHQQ